MTDINVAPEGSVPYEYQKKIREGQKGGVVLVYVNGKDEDEVISKSRFITKLVDLIREHTDGLGTVIKMPEHHE